MDDGIISIATTLLDGAALDARIRHQEMAIQRYREALQKIAGGSINSERLLTSDPPDWRDAFGQLQKIARDALEEKPNG